MVEDAGRQLTKIIEVLSAEHWSLASQGRWLHPKDPTIVLATGYMHGEVTLTVGALRYRGAHPIVWLANQARKYGDENLANRLDKLVG